ncbi:MAG: hypothetical protein ACI4TX_00930 [Christensenellales bacterium]
MLGQNNKFAHIRKYTDIGHYNEARVNEKHREEYEKEQQLKKQQKEEERAK